MSRKERRKLLAAITTLQAALKQSLKVAESAVSIAAETRALLARSEANADQWRQLYEAVQRPASVSLPFEIVPVNGWVN